MSSLLFVSHPYPHGNETAFTATSVMAMKLTSTRIPSPLTQTIPSYWEISSERASSLAWSWCWVSEDYNTIQTKSTKQIKQKKKVTAMNETWLNNEITLDSKLNLSILKKRVHLLPENPSSRFLPTKRVNQNK